MAELKVDSTRLPSVVELEGIDAADLDSLGRRYLADVVPGGVRRAMACESHALNYLQAGFIARALPGARFLHISREPVDNCVSILGQAGGDISIPSHDPAALAAYYGNYLRLMQHWHDLLPGRIMDVSYESLVDKPEMMLRVVCSFLGISYASSLRLGLQLHQRSLGRGRRYLPTLPMLESALSPLSRKSRSA